MNFKTILNTITDQVSPLFNKDLHTLGGAGLAALGVSSGVATTAGFRELIIGAAYALITKIIK